MKRLLLIMLCLLPFCAVNAQKNKKTAPKKEKVPTVVSVGDILPNYGLDTLMLKDTSYMIDYLESQPQDYVELTNYCVGVRTKA